MDAAALHRNKVISVISVSDLALTAQTSLKHWQGHLLLYAGLYKQVGAN